jgi:hypothetical protein
MMLVKGTSEKEREALSDQSNKRSLSDRSTIRQNRCEETRRDEERRTEKRV